MRTIGVVTGARSDYGIYRPLLRRIEADPDLDLHLMVTGMHLLPRFGMTVNEIEEDGFTVGDKVAIPLETDDPAMIARAMGHGAVGFADAYARHRPDVLVVLGDRFEMHAAAVAALPMSIPVAHIHGGEITEGAMDDALRHSMTKLSHLHFVAMDEYARRVEQLGEESWRILVSGALSLDNLKTVRRLSRRELEEKLRIDLSGCSLLVTYHPVTLQYEQTQQHVEALLGALDELGAAVVFTYPNADPGNRVIIDGIEEFARKHASAIVAVNLGTETYFSLMQEVSAMAGNSSSGIIEAASFELPVVNIGDRQAGRARARNVVDVECARQQILEGIKGAVSKDFRDGLRGLRNPYGDGQAADRIVEKLKAVSIDRRLLQKRFHDMKTAGTGAVI